MATDASPFLDVVGVDDAPFGVVGRCWCWREWRCLLSPDGVGGEETAAFSLCCRCLVRLPDDMAAEDRVTGRVLTKGDNDGPPPPPASALPSAPPMLPLPPLLIPPCGGGCEGGWALSGEEDVPAGPVIFFGEANEKWEEGGGGSGYVFLFVSRFSSPRAYLKKKKKDDGGETLRSGFRSEW